MKSLFDERLKRIKTQFRKLEAQAPGHNRDQKIPKTQGVYVFYEKSKAMYVGRSRNLARRIGCHHWGEKSSSVQSSFAVLVAQKELENKGIKLEKYKHKKDSPDYYKKRPCFVEAFDKAKKRVAKMTVCWIEQEYPTDQALLEIYAAVVLNAPYNNFDTH